MTIAEDLDKIYARIIEEHIFAKAADENRLSEVFPGFDSYSTWEKHHISRILKIGKYHYAGATPWPTGSQAVLETADYLYAMVTEFISWSLMFGMCAGYWRYRAGKPDNFYELMYKCSKKYLERFATSIGEQPDLMVYLLNELKNCLTHFVELTDFKSFTGEETIHIWDIWENTLGTMGMKVYVGGVEVGTKWYEEETLADLEKADQ